MLFPDQGPFVLHLTERSERWLPDVQIGDVGVQGSSRQAFVKHFTEVLSFVPDELMANVSDECEYEVVKVCLFCAPLALFCVDAAE